MKVSASATSGLQLAHVGQPPPWRHKVLVVSVGEARQRQLPAALCPHAWWKGPASQPPVPTRDWSVVHLALLDKGVVLALACTVVAPW